jgi:asparagine synthase (glutamine-hydrolysing)
MCGIAGVVRFDEDSIDPGIIHRMTNAIGHRGPDAEGFFTEKEVALGHRRLAIIDLSPSSNQPFVDNTGRFVMVFNGEMYNYQEVKSRITDYVFHTNGDSEVLIAAYGKLGVDCLIDFRGMFAFAIWDKQEKEIFVARDRFGVKPLYYYLDRNKFIFASEQRAILASGLVKRKINENALQDYFSYQSICSPTAAIEGIEQLEAGMWMKVKQGNVDKEFYWDVSSRNANFDFQDNQKTKVHIRELLLQSIKRRLVSDVPVGAFLSGGIDSSVVVGLMTEASTQRPNTFNISFGEKDFDESPFAGIIAQKFKTRHERILLGPNACLDEMQNALDAMDSPSGDGINTYVVSKAVRQAGMTVALSGIGGDELFAGYPFFKRYLQMQQYSWIWKLPASARMLAGSFIMGDKKERIRQLLQANSCSIDCMYPLFRQVVSPGELNRLVSESIGADCTSVVHKKLESEHKNILNLPFLSQVSVAEYLGYTQHTLLKDTDQMSMAVSLEVREPFFDHDLVEFVLGIPDKVKNPIYPKSLLVESVKPLLPNEIVFRKKQGFLFPWSLWLRNELRSFCEVHIKNMAARPFIHSDRLINYWERFVKGDSRIRWVEIWLFIVLEYWMEKNNIE